jgi:excinuclease UvrABC ATPase subunit
MEAPMTDQQVSAPTLGEVLAELNTLQDFIPAHPYNALRASLFGTSQPCETCGGSGDIIRPDRIEPESYLGVCPACNGQGYRYTGGLVERMGEWLSGEGRYVTSAHYVTDQVRAHVLAALSAEIGPNPEGGEHG